MVQRFYGIHHALIGIVLAGCSSPAPPVEEPCPTFLPAQLVPDAVWVVAFDARPPVDARHAAFEQDLVEILLSGHRQIVPATSESAASWPVHCVKTRLELTIESEPAQRRGRLRMWHEGEVVMDRVEVEPQSREPILAGLRVAIVSSLGMDGDPPSLFDPSAPSFLARQQALRSQAEGRLGEAAKILREALELNGGDSALHLRIGEALTAWAAELEPSAEGEENAEMLLERALWHLDESGRLGGSSPLHHLVRARALMALKRNRAAEVELVSVLQGWPAHGEAALRLAELKLARGGAVGFETQLSEVIALVDGRPNGLLSDLLVALGEVHQSAGQTDRAIEAWQRALVAAPAERRVLRSEIQKRLSAAQPFPR